jgi:hypothetical protein
VSDNANWRGRGDENTWIVQLMKPGEGYTATTQRIGTYERDQRSHPGHLSHSFCAGRPRESRSVHRHRAKVDFRNHRSVQAHCRNGWRRESRRSNVLLRLIAFLNVRQDGCLRVHSQERVSGRRQTKRACHLASYMGQYAEDWQAYPHRLGAYEQIDPGCAHQVY